MRRLKTSNWLRDEQGSVTIEFVLSLPILFGTMYMAYAVFHGYMQYARASKALYTTSDLISRYETIDQTRINQLQSLYEAFAVAGDGSLFRATRLDYIAKDPDDPNAVTSNGFETDDGFYEVTWSRPADHELDCSNQSTACHRLQEALVADDLANYELPTIGDGAHVILVDVYTPYEGPITEGAFKIVPGLDKLNWNMHQFIWPRNINGLTFETGTS